MNTIMNLRVLILSVFLAVTVIGCSDTGTSPPTHPVSPGVPIPSDDTSSGHVEEIWPDEVLPPEEDEEIWPDEVLPPEEDEEIWPDEVLPPEED